MIRPVHFIPLLLALCGLPVVARAQGYGFYEQSACAMGRAGAGVAAPCDDGSAIFYNPAALTLTPTTVLGTAANVVAPRGTFTDDVTSQVSSLKKRNFLVPAIYFAHPVNPRLAFGIGVFAPYGLTADWPTSSEGRFLGYFSSLRAIYVQPTAAFRLTDRVAVGGGVDISHVSLELRRRVDLAPVPLPGAPRLTFQALGVPAEPTSPISISPAVVTVSARTSARSKGQRQRLHRNPLSASTARRDRQRGCVHGPDPHWTGLRAGSWSAGRNADQCPRRAAIHIWRYARPAISDNSIALPRPSRDRRRDSADQPLVMLVDYQFSNWGLFDQVVIDNEVAPATTIVESYRGTHGVRLAPGPPSAGVPWFVAGSMRIPPARPINP